MNMYDNIPEGYRAEYDYRFGGDEEVYRAPKKKMIVGEKVVTGHWDGQEIWRNRTAEEVLLNELPPLRKKYPEAFISEQEAQIHEE